MNSYLRFCIFYGRVPVPADQLTLRTYVAFLARSLKPLSVNCYLNIVRIMHLEAGFENPLKDNFELQLICRGVARQLGTPPIQKLPLTVEILEKIVTKLDFSLSSDLAFWAACLIAFYGMLRKSTLIPISERQIENCIWRSDVINLCVDSFVIQIRHSKMIQFGQRVLQIPFCFCAVATLCPVRALILHLIASRLPSLTPLFSFSRNGKVLSLTHKLFVTRLRSLLSICGFEPTSYSGHSFRRGGCTISYEAGLSLIDIKLRGDWKSHAFERYLHVPMERVFASAQALSSCVANKSSNNH